MGSFSVLDLVWVNPFKLDSIQLRCGLDIHRLCLSQMSAKYPVVITTATENMRLQEKFRKNGKNKVK